jgi:NAD(P)-dependent dehydrogenase (short-subunit alcohol dehydrogenase family)
MDQANAKSVEDAVTFAGEITGKIDIAVICAGIQGPLGPIDNFEVKDIDDTFIINLLGSRLLSQVFDGQPEK